MLTEITNTLDILQHAKVRVILHGRCCSQKSNDEFCPFVLVKGVVLWPDIQPVEDFVLQHTSVAIYWLII